MSVLVTLLADALVAILLVASIVSSRRLAARIAMMKADETAMRETIGNLVAATDSAERAIAGLRHALDECDAKLGGSLESGRRMAGTLAAQVSAGEGVLAQIGAIVSQAQGSQAQGSQAQGSQPKGSQASKPARERSPFDNSAFADLSLADRPLAKAPLIKAPLIKPPMAKAPEPAAAPAPVPADSAESAARGARISAMLATAEALTARVRARAA